MMSVYRAQPILPVKWNSGTYVGQATAHTFENGDWAGTGVAPRLGNGENWVADAVNDQDDRWQDIRFLGNVFVDVKIIDFTITKVGTQRTVTLNGTRFLENESGGIIWQIGNGVEYVVHRATGSMDAVFGNGTSRTWSFARQKLFTGAPSEFVITVSGFGSANGYENLTVWGTNRKW